MTAVQPWGRPGPVAARVNWGRWICDCPVCTSALQLQPGTGGFRCWDCGASIEVVWPDVAMQRGVERLLMMRADPKTRNWTNDETLEDLLRENAVHGVYDSPGLEGLFAQPGRELLVVAPDRIVVDRLPETAPLSAGRRPRLEIGA